MSCAGHSSRFARLTLGWVVPLCALIAWELAVQLGFFSSRMLPVEEVSGTIPNRRHAQDTQHCRAI